MAHVFGSLSCVYNWRHAPDLYSILSPNHDQSTSSCSYLLLCTAEQLSKPTIKLTITRKEENKKVITRENKNLCGSANIAYVPREEERRGILQLAYYL